MTGAPDDPVPLFHGPVAPGIDLRRLARRAAILTLTAIAHAAAVLLFVAADLLTLDPLNRPKAEAGTPIVFRPPALPPGGSGGGSRAPAGTRPATAVPPGTAPALRPPAPRPTVIPLPPPADEVPAGAGDARWDAVPGSGDAGHDPSGGPGTGGGDGEGDGPGGPGGPGDGPPGDGTIYDEGHPGITPPVRIPSPAYPRYPDLARRAGVQGTVVLLIVIDRDGRVGEIEVLRSPDPRFGFDLAAVEAVKQWRYRPALLGGRPVAVQAGVTIEFTISR